MQPQAASPPFLTGNGTLNKLAGIDFKQLSLSQKLNENQSGEVRRPVVPWDRVAAPVQITALSAGCGAQNWGTTAWWVSTSGRVALFVAVAPCRCGPLGPLGSAGPTALHKGLGDARRPCGPPAVTVSTCFPAVVERALARQ